MKTPFSSPPVSPSAPNTAAMGPIVDDTPTGPTKRSLQVYKVAAVAAALAAVGFLVATNHSTPTTYVVRVAQPIAALQTVSSSQLQTIALPKSAIEPGAITGSSSAIALRKAQQIKGSTLYPLAVGTQLRPDEFSTITTGVGGTMTSTQRLMSITANPASAIAGALVPGDHVDILAVSTASPPLANIVATNVPIVAVSTSTANLQQAAASQSGSNLSKTPQQLLPARPIPGVYTIRVNATQAPQLALVDSQATLYLLYRAPGAVSVPVLPLGLQQAICEGPASTSHGATPAGVALGSAAAAACAGTVTAP